MLLGVVSDTHGDTYALEKVIKEFESVDIAIHLGDNTEDAEILMESLKCKVVYVKGNCDINSKDPLELIEEVEGVRILITHGHKYNVKSNLVGLLYRAQELEAEIALFGHTHISEVSMEEGIWLINPGSVALPRDNHCSVAIIKIEGENIIPNIKLI